MNKIKKACPHSYCDDAGLCIRCGYNTFRLTNKELKALKQIDMSKIKKGIAYNPRIHKKLTCDKVISIASTRDGLWRELVGVYWKGMDGLEVLFETTPSKATKIMEIFNEKTRA